MSQRQSSNQWSGGIAAYPAPKYCESKNLLVKFSPRFFGIKTASSSLIIFQRAKLSTRSWCNWTFWRKNAAGSSPKGFCSYTTMPRLTGHLEPRMSWSPTLFSGSGPIRLPLVPWTEKTIGKSPFFVWCRGHCCHGDLVRRTTFWIFFEWLAKVTATG